MFKLIIISLSFFLVNPQITPCVYAHDRGSIQEQSIMPSTRYCLVDFFQRLLCGTPELPESSYQSIVIKKNHRPPLKSAGIDGMSGSDLKRLTSDTLLHISLFLKPVDLINVMKTCKKLNRIYKDEKLWKGYANYHKYLLWDESIPSMHRVFGCYYYDKFIKRPFAPRSYICQAAKLTHPEAVILKDEWDHKARMAIIEQNRRVASWEIHSYHQRSFYLDNKHV